MKKPTRRRVRAPLSSAQRHDLAARAQYVGSSEHKERRWWGGLPMARQLPGGRVGRAGRQKTTISPLVDRRDSVRDGMVERRHQGRELPIRAVRPAFSEKDLVPRSFRSILVWILYEYCRRTLQGMADREERTR